METHTAAEMAEEKTGQAVCTEEADEGENSGQDHAGPYVAEHVVAELVTDYTLDLRGRKPGDEGVPQHNALAAAHARDIRVDLGGVDALIHLEHARSLDARTLGLGENLGFEDPVRHGAEFVEKWRYPQGRDQQSQRVEGKGQGGGPKPPAVWASSQ